MLKSPTHRHAFPMLLLQAFAAPALVLFSIALASASAYAQGSVWSKENEQMQDAIRREHYEQQRRSGTPSGGNGDWMLLLLLEAAKARAGISQSPWKLKAEYDKAAISFSPSYIGMVAGTWHGTYVCQQGTTGLTLRLDPRSDGGLDGRFIFYPDRSNPNVPKGEFEVRILQGHTHMFVEPVQWIKRPPTFHMVGLAGVIDTSKLTFIGAVQTNGCKQFALKKA